MLRTEKAYRIETYCTSHRVDIPWRLYLVDMLCAIPGTLSLRDMSAFSQTSSKLLLTPCFNYESQMSTGILDLFVIAHDNSR